MKNKKAFSFVELIIVLSIIALLAIVVTKLSMDSQDKTTNAKVKSDITTLKNALLSAGEQEKKLPLPD
jgi:prepilin-type cleavage/methylation N-terminal domain protein